ncbi:hypothetical protein O3P69_008159 [Scylla paramamosain]|uniref:Uncharacterized protein n=1 Tax=Scylla paramamosain TaxID=85552 RepID=A0AAW0T1H5_SCYPA
MCGVYLAMTLGFYSFSGEEVVWALGGFHAVHPAILPPPCSRYQVLPWFTVARERSIGLAGYPLPMKMRAFPQSFWLQPNKNNLPPSCSTLPPLILGKDSSDMFEIRPVTPPEEDRVATAEQARGEPAKAEKEAELRSIKVCNPDLLSRLFDSVEQGDKKRVAVVRRGRPRKPPSTVLPRVLRDDDPCLVSTVTESILPLLPDKTPVSSGSSTPLGIRQGPQVLEMVNLRDGDRTISLPSLNVEHNYNQILSELVLKL